MEMADYRISLLADADLREISDYTLRSFGLKQNARYRAGLLACFQNLAKNPELGRKFASKPGLRFYGYRSHTVYYMPEAGGIRIVRVLHHRMDRIRHLFGL